MNIKVDTQQAKKELFKVRARFQRLQRTVIGEGLMASSEPIVAAAQRLAPSRSGRLRSRIGPTLIRRRGEPVVLVGPIRLSKRDKGYPFYGLFQERGWKATGRATRKTAKSARPIPGKHFLRGGGQAGFPAAEKIFADKVLGGLQEIQTAGEATGLV